MFMDRKQSVLSSCQLFPTWLTDSVQSQSNPRKLFYGSKHSDSKVYMESQKTQSSQHNNEGKEQSQRTDAT